MPPTELPQIFHESIFKLMGWHLVVCTSGASKGRADQKLLRSNAITLSMKNYCSKEVYM